MAITAITALEVAAAVPADATTEFTTTSSFVFYADGFEVGQNAVLYRLGPSGNYYPATNCQGGIFVSAVPNMVRVEAPGTFRVKKDATAANVSVGYEEV